MKSVAFNLVPFTLNLNAGGILLNQCRNIAFVLLCTVVLNACGYRFAGQGAYPKGVEKILIEVFENRTSKVGIERVVTNQVVFEFTRQREKSLTSRAEDADAILKGVIRTISTQTIARVGTEVASQREVVMTVDLKLVQLAFQTVKPMMLLKVATSLQTKTRLWPLQGFRSEYRKEFSAG
jgi:outer membrane lipopolysaccharide assembly protein LptE/RlpB